MTDELLTRLIDLAQQAGDGGSDLVILYLGLSWGIPFLIGCLVLITIYRIAVLIAETNRTDTVLLEIASIVGSTAYSPLCNSERRDIVARVRNQCK